MRVFRLFALTALIVAGVLLLMVISDLIIPSRPIKVDTTPHIVIKHDVSWEDDVNNPDNAEFVLEVAFNHECAPEQVTQDMFNARYLTD